MAYQNDRLKDYVQVNERLIEFYEKHPNGSIQSEIVSMSETLVVVKAYAYRDLDDPRPGIGHSSLIIPGSTPYTKDSELENAETSAWGRALAALGFEVKRGIATEHEIRIKRDDSPKAAPRNPPVQGPPVVATETPRPAPLAAQGILASPNHRKTLFAAAKAKMGDGQAVYWLKQHMDELGCTKETMTLDHFKMLLEAATNWKAPDDPSYMDGDGKD